MQENLATATDEAQSGGIRAAVLGINDGLVTNVSLILGVAGATPDPKVVLLAGVASLVAGACSMAVGEFVSMQAQVQLLQRVLGSVRRAFQKDADRLAELQRVFTTEGLSPAVASGAAADLGNDCDRSIDFYARVVLGINPNELGSPWVAAIVSMLTFSIGALVPLVPWYFLDSARASQVSIAGSVVASLIIGGLLGYHTDRRWFAGALRQLIVLVLAASATYGAGRLFHTVVQ